MKKLYFIVVLLVASELLAQAFRFIRPVEDKYPTNGSYLYGEPSISSEGNAHRGIDISISYDTVYAAADGIIDFVGYDPSNSDGYEPDGAGNYIFIKSKWSNVDVYLLYAHLSKPLVEENKYVTAGEAVGISGNTGNSTGPHLHFEIREGTRNFSALRTRRNPELWVAMKGTGAIYGKIPGASNNTRVDIFPDPKPRPPYITYGWSLTYNFSDPYIGSDDVYKENYAIGDVLPGIYTITALNGMYKRTVIVEAGKVVNAEGSTGISESNALSESFVLYQNYPNPFNPTTTIRFSLPQREHVTLKVFDVLGREVATLVEEELNAGEHSVYFNTRGISSGIYFYRLNTSTFSQTKAMGVVK